MWLRHLFLHLSMLIATWNVNSVKARLGHVVDYLSETKPDILCLQELKCLDEMFPRAEIEDAGYNVVTHGQKTYNGVAILSRFPIEDITRGLPHFEDTQSRYIEAVISSGDLTCRIASIYLPNGNPVEDGNSEKYQYKLAFMEALQAHAQNLLDLEEISILSGDYNVIPNAIDCYSPEAWRDDALFRDETRAAFRRLKNLGFTDAYELLNPLGEDSYSFWDYQAGAFQKNNGIRIDHHLLSPRAVDRLKAARIDKQMRAREKPSDHVPVVIELEP